MKGTPTASRITPEGGIVELVFDPLEVVTKLAHFRDEEWSLEERLVLPSGEALVPYSAENNLLQHKVVLLPSKPEEYGSEAALLADVRAFIRRYVDLSPLFEEIASYYVLFTWIFDAFNEVPYLRVQGDFGSGKSRFLLTVGSLCYKPIFASGASTVSPIFRIIDAFRGTLVIDESDFRESDEKAEVVKIFNNGNARGFPVLRTEVNAKKEFDPKAYTVFGPKIIATRNAFKDRALESRCLSEEMGGRPLRSDIPINLPDTLEAEALELRNKLLLFRFRNLRKPRDLARMTDRSIEPRLSQIFAPLLSTIDDPETRRSILALSREYSRDLVSERGLDLEAQLLEVVQGLPSDGLSVKEITSKFQERHGDDYGNRVTPKWIGSILRKKLYLKPRRVHGVFVIPPEELPKLARLYEKYGLAPEGDMVDVGDVPQGGEAPGALESQA